MIQAVCRYALRRADRQRVSDLLGALAIVVIDAANVMPESVQQATESAANAARDAYADLAAEARKGFPKTDPICKAGIQIEAAATAIRASAWMLRLENLHHTVDEAIRLYRRGLLQIRDERRRVHRLIGASTAIGALGTVALIFVGPSLAKGRR